MRKVIFGVANSVDNYIATQDGGLDWLLFSDEAGRMMAEMWKRIDTVVMGRRTFELAAESGAEAPVSAETYVLSSTLNPADHDDVTVVCEDTATLVRRLKERDGGDICVMGGSEIARQCLRAGLIDELHLNVHPVLLGAGVPLFLGLEEAVDLELFECRELPHGCVALAYRVRREK